MRSELKLFLCTAHSNDSLALNVCLGDLPRLCFRLPRSSLQQGALLPNVQALMMSQTAAPFVPPATHGIRAHEGLLASMYPSVGMQIALHAERLSAISHVTHILSRFAGLLASTLLDPSSCNSRDSGLDIVGRGRKLSGVSRDCRRMSGKCSGMSSEGGVSGE